MRVGTRAWHAPRHTPRTRAHTRTHTHGGCVPHSRTACPRSPRLTLDRHPPATERAYTRLAAGLCGCRSGGHSIASHLARFANTHTRTHTHTHTHSHGTSCSGPRLSLYMSAVPWAARSAAAALRSTAEPRPVRQEAAHANFESDSKLQCEPKRLKQVNYLNRAARHGTPRHATPVRSLWDGVGGTRHTWSAGTRTAHYAQRTRVAVPARHSLRNALTSPMKSGRPARNPNNNEWPASAAGPDGTGPRTRSL